MRSIMNTTLSFSDDLVRAADKLARQMGISRNDLFRKAMERYLEQQAAIDGEAVDAVNGNISKSGVDPLIAVASQALLNDEDW